MNTKCVWILGAPDPEMDVIRDLLEKSGQTVVCAKKDGRRVRPEEAYGWGSHEPLPDGVQTVYLVECDVPLSSAYSRIAVDHHRPGDPGYGLGPDLYWEASSIGQVCGHLGIPPTPALRMTAAADHCLRAAYTGLCPGVDAGDLRRWRVAQIAELRGLPIEEIEAEISDAVARLLQAPAIAIAPICDRPPSGREGHHYRFPMGCSYCGVRLVADCRESVIPGLPDAAAMLGVAYLAALPSQDGRTKVVLGCADEVQLRAWPLWAATHGIVDLYGGDPARGFAGGYK